MIIAPLHRVAGSHAVRRMLTDFLNSFEDLLSIKIQSCFFLLVSPFGTNPKSKCKTDPTRLDVLRLQPNRDALFPGLLIISATSSFSKVSHPREFGWSRSSWRAPTVVWFFWVRLKHTVTKFSSSSFVWIDLKRTSTSIKWTVSQNTLFLRSIV